MAEAAIIDGYGIYSQRSIVVGICIFKMGMNLELAEDFTGNDTNITRNRGIKMCKKLKRFCV